MIKAADLVIDTHTHAGLLKYEPIESLVDKMFRYGVDHAVLVQHRYEYDNRYLIECAQRYPGRFVVAMLVDTQAKTVADDIRRWAKQPYVRGMRVYCADPEVVWQTVDELGLVVTLSGPSKKLAEPDVRRRIERYQRATFCLEHLALPDGDEPAPYPTYRRALALAELPNVYLKVSGFYQCARQPFPYDDTKRFADLALAVFGPQRMMWASDFPPVSFREGYHNTLGFISRVFPDLSAEDRDWLFGRTAQKVWRFDQG